MLVLARFNADTINAQTHPDKAERRAAYRGQRERHTKLLHSLKGDEDTLFSIRLFVVLRLLSLLLKATGMWARGHRNALRPVLRETTWQHPCLPPALDGLRLLHISDLHYRRSDLPFRDHVEQLVDGLEVDLCVFTGDYRFGHTGPNEHVPENIGRLVERIRARHGFFGTLGNHDLFEFLDSLRGVGVDMLWQEGRELEINGARIWIGGTDDSHILQCGDVELACEGAGPEHFRILLSHTPELVDQAVAQGVHVYLCGHTHGGQICLPLLGPVELNAQCDRRHVHGEWREGTLFGLTSAGAGTTDIPIRFNCPGEIHLITLRSGA